jgi:hypothetical protein
VWARCLLVLIAGEACVSGLETIKIGPGEDTQIARLFNVDRAPPWPRPPGTAGWPGRARPDSARASTFLHSRSFASFGCQFEPTSATATNTPTAGRASMQCTASRDLWIMIRSVPMSLYDQCRVVHSLGFALNQTARQERTL